MIDKLDKNATLDELMEAIESVTSEWILHNRGQRSIMMVASDAARQDGNMVALQSGNPALLGQSLLGLQENLSPETQLAYELAKAHTATCTKHKRATVEVVAQKRFTEQELEERYRKGDFDGLSDMEFVEDEEVVDDEEPPRQVIHLPGDSAIH